MPVEQDDVTATKLMADVEVNDRIITPVKWVYVPESREMEIILEMKKAGADSIDDYEFTAMSRKRGIIKADKVKRINDTYVIHISGLKEGWNELSFRIDAKDVKPSEFQTVKLYAIEDKIEIAKKIESQSDLDYLMEVAERKIAGYKAEIKSIEKDIKKQEKIISDGEKAIKDLEKDVKYQTEEERQKTKDAASKVNTELQAAEGKISEYKNDIDELNEKIKNQKMRLEDLKEGAK